MFSVQDSLPSISDMGSPHHCLVTSALFFHLLPAVVHLLHYSGQLLQYLYKQGKSACSRQHTKAIQLLIRNTLCPEYATVFDVLIEDSRFIIWKATVLRMDD